MQTTIRSAVTFTGTGLHSGLRARMTVHPASAEYGIWFRRTDVIGRDPMVQAHWSAVENAKLCTELSNAAGVKVSTVEHVMAALAGCGIHNALVEIDGPEVPILDGSSAPFASAFLARGVRELDAPLRCFEVLKPVEVREGHAVARLEPSDTLEIDFEIDFADAAIGHQHRLGADDPVAFGRDAGQGLARLDRLGDRGPHGGEIRTAPQKAGYRDEILELTPLRDNGGLVPQRLHEQPVVAHRRSL